MKKIIIIFVIVFSIKSLNALTSPVIDTLAYLQTIIANKAFFIGKPFSVLNDSLGIQIKLFAPYPGLHSDITKENSTSFSFYFPQSASDFYLSYPRLDIYWQTPLVFSQSDLIWVSNNGGIWLPNAYNLYFNRLIADIKLRE